MQSSIAVGNLAVKRSDPRWYDLTMANTLFGGAFNSRIVHNLREEKGYTYSSASVLTGFAVHRGAEVGAGSENAERL